MLLIGVDTKKNEEILNAAYNDAAGITAKFNQNLIQRIKDELDVECDPNNFDHQAYYNPDAGRIEMYLVSNAEQTLKLNGHTFRFNEGESLHTENSYKYSTDEFIQLADKCGFKPVKFWTDPNKLFAIYLLEIN